MLHLDRLHYIFFSVPAPSCGFSPYIQVRFNKWFSKVSTGLTLENLKSIATV